MSLTCQPHYGRCQALVEGPRRERRNACGLNAAIKRLVVSCEAFVMRSVTRFVNIEDCRHQTGPVGVATDSAGGLNIFGARLWLTEDHHETETCNIDAHRNHICGYRHVNAV